MTETPPETLIAYDELMQDALRALVGRVLAQVVANGGELPGAHHFFITFRTHAPGVQIPNHLKARYPEEMTIVLQNKFWDLNVSESGFSVGLSFNQVPTKLIIPFAAMTAFLDPAAEFGLHFEPIGGEAEPEEAAPEAVPAPPAAVTETGEDGSNVVSVDFGRKK